MLYIDTSVIVKLYIKEKFSFEASNWIRKNNEAILLTGFHELEFTNAVYLKRFRSEITSEQANLIFSKFHEHQRDGIYYRAQIDWPETITMAIDLARNHTKNIGSRSLDVIHIAAALAVNANRFLTLDERQEAVARAAGLKIEKLR